MFDFQVRGEEGSERGFHPALADLDRSIDAKGMQPCERFRGLVGRIRNKAEVGKDDTLNLAKSVSY